MLRLSLVLLFTLPVSIALAQPAAPDDYDQLMQQGEAAVVGSDWNACLDRFTRAHKLKASAVTYLAIGRCALEKKDYISALRNLQEGMRYTLPDLQRERAQDIYQLARRHLGRYRPTLSPQQALLRIDGQPPELDSDGAFWLSVGSHQLQVSADGFRPLEVALVVNPNDDKSFSYTLEPLPITTKGEPESERITDIPGPGPAADAPEHPTLVQWLLLGGAGAVTITGGILLGVALADKSSVEHANGKRLSEIQAAHDRVPVLSTLGGVMLGVGLAGAGATLGWILLGDSESRASTTLRLGPAGAQLRGVF